MKLLHKSYLQASVLLLPALLIGTLFSFLIIRYIVYEETDEFLTYEMQRIERFHQKYNDLPEDHKAIKILEDTAPHSAFFRDTLILEPADNEKIPHRELWFGLVHNQRHFTLVLRNLLPGTDDLIEGTLLIMAGMMALLLIIFVLMVGWISKKTWKPFYGTLTRLKSFELGKEIPRFPSTPIDEFNTLQHSLTELLQKSDNDFRRTREFNENASHEFQTHLSIIRANTEALLNHSQLNQHDAKYLAGIHRSTLSLSRVQNALLLLSKIGNREYNHPVPTNLSDNLRRILEIYSDSMELRQLKSTVNADDIAEVNIDPGLADILLTNLVKNAIRHNIEGGNIEISLTSKHFRIANTGRSLHNSTDELMERFVKGENGNMGIGLAIVKQICELNDFSIRYELQETNIHSISIDF